MLSKCPVNCLMMQGIFVHYSLTVYYAQYLQISCIGSFSVTLGAAVYGLCCECVCARLTLSNLHDQVFACVRIFIMPFVCTYICGYIMCE